MTILYILAIIPALFFITYWLIHDKESLKITAGLLVITGFCALTAWGLHGLLT